MKLTILTPTAVVREVEDVARIRATDATGDFGVHPGHVDMLTILEPSVLDYTAGGATTYVAVSGGVLKVEDGRVTVLSEDAVAGDDLPMLRTTAIETFRKRARTEEAAATGFTRFHVTLVRELGNLLWPGSAGRESVS
jgi:F-type H+-transporting ATPase subunit epsilon